MRIYCVYPSVGSLIRMLILVSCVCVLLALTSYPVEEWGGVAIIWTLAFSATSVGLALFNSWAYAGTARRFAQALARVGVDDVEGFFRSVSNRSSVVIGNVYAMVVVAVIATGGGLVVVGLTLPTLGFTQFPDALKWGGVLLAVGVVSELLVMLMARATLRAVRSLSDERLEEVVERLRRRPSQGREILRPRLVAALVLLIAVVGKVVSASPMPDRISL